MLVLASASPRRRDLLTQAGYTFEVLPADVPEEVRPGETPIGYVLRLAREKAETVAASPEFAALRSRHDEPTLILGADTTVVAPNGEILGKPEDDADATRMLRLLGGATHKVITGVAIVAPTEKDTITEVAAEVTWVTMLTPTDDELAEYIATGEPQGKAGAYAIQGRVARWIPRIHGCYFNVVGLPRRCDSTGRGPLNAENRTLNAVFSSLSDAARRRAAPARRSHDRRREAPRAVRPSPVPGQSESSRPAAQSPSASASKSPQVVRIISASNAVRGASWFSSTDS